MRARLVLVALLAGACTKVPADWPALERDLKERFPDVARIAPGELERWLAAPERPPPLLLDARSAEEYAVSHLPGARRADSEAVASALLRRVPKDEAIVVYCSVGYRSSALAERLAERGFTRVYDLDGSIFRWANEGRPLIAGGRRVRVVHPYDSRWGRFLDRRLWSHPLR